ncbi:MAG: four-carbon acid sugar kinase family protein [Synergistaceae bacterium]|nr:four-carbon acid sugar kinase family protein [Synergistaceae bacterium]
MITIPQCLVIADDLTGGNATGVLLAKTGYKAHSVLSYEHSRDNPNFTECDCLIITTDSRGLTQKEAYSRVKHASRVFSGDDVKLYSNRIDSTLRGNVGTETDAMLDSLGEDYIAVCAPCFPSSGRTLVGGYLLVDGLPLHKTNIAIDPKTPVKTSDIAEIFQSQSKYKVSSLYLSDLMNGKHALASKINSLAGQGSRIIIIDCVTNEDLNLIADAVITSGRKIIAVDPGAFTSTLARKLITPQSKKERRKILAVVGSVNPNTRAQMEKLWLAQRPIANVFVESKKLLVSEEAREQEISRVTSEILELAKTNTVLTITGDGIYPEKRIDFKQYSGHIEILTGRINASLAEMALRILTAEPAFRGLYASGGDVTQAVCAKFRASGLDLRDEVLPLAAYGLFSGGEFDGLHVVTKGGSQGNSDAINLCINYLKSKLFI